MKKLLNLFSLTALMASVILSSCSTSNDPKPAPTIDAYIGGAGTTTYTGAGPVSITYTATTGENIQQIDAIATYTDNLGAAQTANLTGFPKTKSFTSSTTDNGTVSYTLPVATPITVTFTVTDSKGNKASKAVTINKGAAINTSTVVLLGAQSSTSPSFVNLQDFTTYTVSNSDASQANVDLALFYSSTNNMNLAAPSNSTLATILTNVANWSTKNTTQLYTTSVTSAQFDAISDDATFSTIIAASGTASDRVSNIAQGQVYAFTARGKNGLFKVGTVTSSASGSAQITIKVQK